MLDDLCKAIDSQGSLAVIRHGFNCFGKLIRVACFVLARSIIPIATGKIDVREGVAAE